MGVLLRHIARQIPEAVNTELYGSRIKNCFNPRFEAESADTDLLRAYIARDQVAQFLLVVTFVIIFYIILSYLNILPAYWQKGQPIVMGILTLYVFLVVPFKNTNFIASLRSFFMKDGPFLNMEEDFAADECMFLAFVVLFYAGYYIGRFINRKFQVQEKIEKKLHFSIRPLFEKVYTGTVIFSIILYCLNLGMQDGRGLLNLIINLVIFLALLSYAVMFLVLNETKQKAFNFIKKISNCINKYLFPFLRLCVNLGYYVIFIALMMLDIAPYSTVCTIFHSCASSVFFHLFTHSLGFYFILTKLCLVGCFVGYCIYNDKKENVENLKTPEHTKTGTSGTIREHSYGRSSINNSRLSVYGPGNPEISPTLEESQEESRERVGQGDWNNQSSSSSSYSREEDCETTDGYFFMNSNHEISMVKCDNQTGLKVDALEQKSNEEVLYPALSNDPFQQPCSSTSPDGRMPYEEVARPSEETFAGSDDCHAFETMQPIQTPEPHPTEISMPSFLQKNQFISLSIPRFDEMANLNPSEEGSFLIFDNEQQAKNNSLESLGRELSEDSSSTICNSASDVEEPGVRAGIQIKEIVRISCISEKRIILSILFRSSI